MNFVKKHGLIISLLFVVIAVLTGGAGVCLAEGAAVVEPDPANPDPVDPNENNMRSPDGNGAGQDLPGTQASATQLRRAKLIQDQYDPDIVEFRADQYVLLNHAQTIAKQRNVGGHDYEVPHFQIGEESLMLKTTATINAGDTVVLTPDNTEGNFDLLGVSSTIVVKGVPGYVKGSQTRKDGGPLVLFVTAANDDHTQITCRPINGIAKVEGTKSDYLRDYTCPAIPSGTSLIVTATAASESQMIVQPDNTQPRPVTVYLQKMEFNILITDHEREVIKKVSWGLADIKAQALANFKKKQEYALWISQQGRFLMRTKDGNEEFVYTMQGVLRQLTNTLGLDGPFKWEHITAIGKIQFTNFSQSKEAYVYCGKNKIAELNNMPQILHHTVEYKHHKTDYGIVVRDLVSNFGTLHIVHAPALDDLGYEDFMIVMDTPHARYYHNIEKKDYTIDLKKAGNDAREASRYIYIESGALALVGYNSILVGPSDQIVDKNMSDNSNPIEVVDAIPANPTDGMIISFDGLLSEDGPVTKVAALPANPTEGDIIAPTQDIVVGEAPNTTTYEEGKYYIYESNAWSEYDGVVLDGDKVWQYDADNNQWVEYTGTV